MRGFRLQFRFTEEAQDHLQLYLYRPLRSLSLSLKEATEFVSGSFILEKINTCSCVGFKVVWVGLLNLSLGTFTK
jgi:hypothetical protein